MIGPGGFVAIIVLLVDTNVIQCTLHTRDHGRAVKLREIADLQWSARFEAYLATKTDAPAINAKS